MYFTYSGLIRVIEADCYYNTTNDKALNVVVERWLDCTVKKNRTWKTLLAVAKKLVDHTLSKYLKENGISGMYVNDGGNKIVHKQI